MKYIIDKLKILEEVSIDQLEKGYRKGIVSKGLLYRRELPKVYPTSTSANALNATGKTTIGPMTVPVIQDYVKNGNVNILKKNGADNDTIKRLEKDFQMTPGVYAKGSSYNHIKNNLQSSTEEIGTSAQRQRGMNALINNHEQNEYSVLTKNSKHEPRTMAGGVFGHHSLSKILGRERNNIVTGDDTIKAGAGPLIDYRKKSGEELHFNHFLPADQHGKKMVDDYGSGPRLNRRHLYEMYRKELGLPIGTKFETKNRIKALNSQIINQLKANN